MGVEINITTKPTTDRLIGWTQEIEREVLSDFTDFWKLLEKFLIDTLKRRFATEGYHRWAQLSPRYKAWKEKHYPGKPILQLTGALHRAATQRGAEGNIYEVTKTSMVWGVDTEEIPHAYFVQSGVKAPARIWCKLEHEEEKEVLDNARFWIRKKLDEKIQRLR